MKKFYETTFDFSKFATHDGLSKTTFFKSYNLECAWCNKPERISNKRRPVYFPKKCVHCASCVAESEYGGISMDNKKNLHFDITKNEDWDNIMDICPTGAIAWN